MSTLYIANTGTTGSRGVWYGSALTEKYSYESFVPGEDANLDQVAFYAYDYLVYTQPTNFGLSLYSDGAGSSQPGGLITTLSGPSTPTGSSYNNYTPSTPISLSSGSKYWLGFQLSSPTANGDNTRVRLGTNSGGFSTLGAGWRVPDHLSVENGVTTAGATPVMYSLYATSRAVCFCKGTLIKLADGCEKPIENLSLGTFIATSSGPLPIKWIARRTIQKSALDDFHYWHALPIRIAKDSIELGLPHSHLYVSGSHAIHVDGRLVNACFLENGISITRAEINEFPDCIQYFHLEFEDEVLVAANGLPCCSYANERNRRSFDNYPEFIRLYLNADTTAANRLDAGPRNKPSLAGHKDRVMRAIVSS